MSLTVNLLAGHFCTHGADILSIFLPLRLLAFSYRTRHKYSMALERYPLASLILLDICILYKILRVLIII